ncbi:hypothetical protein GQ54DRAFT_44549 [Martensiomyces pterosporus]|nr:hypothetical protein GQ54DRAFT_44549 [Martensiomyces pterosporus]
MSLPQGTPAPADNAQGCVCGPEKYSVGAGCRCFWSEDVIFLAGSGGEGPSAPLSLPFPISIYLLFSLWLLLISQANPLFNCGFSIPQMSAPLARSSAMFSATLAARRSAVGQLQQRAAGLHTGKLICIEGPAAQLRRPPSLHTRAAANLRFSPVSALCL